MHKNLVPGMKYVLISFLFLSGCINDENLRSARKLNSGIYNGTFQYNDTSLWESIGITGNSFEEYASGGIWSQKYPNICLTKGKWIIIKDSIYFHDIQIAQPNPHDCIDQLLLKGSYYIKEISDSTMVFWRNSLFGEQVYDLKLFFTLE